MIIVNINICRPNKWLKFCLNPNLQKIDKTKAMAKDLLFADINATKK